MGHGSISVQPRQAELFLGLADAGPGPAALALEDLGRIRAIACAHDAAAAAKRLGVCLASLYRHQRRLAAATGIRTPRELRGFAERIGLRLEDSEPPLRPASPRPRTRLPRGAAPAPAAQPQPLNPT